MNSEDDIVELVTAVRMNSKLDRQAEAAADIDDEHLGWFLAAEFKTMFGRDLNADERDVAIAEYYDADRFGDDDDDHTWIPNTNAITLTERPPVKFIQTVTYLNGKNVDEMSTEEIATAIANKEKEIKTLSEIENKPKKLVDLINKHSADIASLLTYLDSKAE